MASILKVDKLDPQSGTALEIGTSGDTITVPSGASLTLTDSTLSLPTTINTDKIDPKSGTALEIGSSGDTITIPSGATFTQSGTMNASAITAGTIATARLGSGTASSSTVLYGDQTYKAEPGGGKLLQTQSMTYGTLESTTSTSYVSTSVTDSITPASTSNKVLVMATIPCISCKTTTGSANTRAISYFALYRGDHSGTKLTEGSIGWSDNVAASAATNYCTFATVSLIAMDSPSTTSAQDYTVAMRSESGRTTYANYSFWVNATSTLTLMEIDGT